MSTGVRQIRTMTQPWWFWRLVGPMGMVVLAGMIELLARSGLRVPSPVSILMAGVVAATLVGGVVPGLISAVMSIGYDMWYDHVFGVVSWTGTRVHFVEVTVVTVGMVVMPALLRRWSIALERERADRQHAEASALRLARLVQGLHVIVWQTDRSLKRFLFVSPKAAEIFGYPMVRWRGDEGVAFYLGCVHGADRDRVRRAWRSGRDGGDKQDLTYRVVTADGRVLWIRDLGQPNGGSGRGWSGVLVDITSEREAKRQLAAMNETLEKRVSERTEQLRALAIELSRAEQRERRRLAEVLHDGLQQLLVAAKMRLGVLSRRLDDEQLCAMVGDVTELVERSVTTSRSLATELVPPVLYEAGLIPALRQLKRRMDQEHGLTVNLETDGEAEPKSEDLRLMLFQAVRELLLNVIKHAGVSEARVVLGKAGEGEIVLMVEDGGGGFSGEAGGNGDGGEAHFGLFHIRERLEAMGGRMEIDSSPRRGARVSLLTPSRERGLETVGSG